MKEIPLTQGQVAVVADDDYEWLSEPRWCADWNPHTRSFYARRTVLRPKRRKLRMHNAIWEYHNGPIPDGRTVDHADRNTLNNCRSNLRLATPSQQAQNKGLQRNNTSGHRGVRLLPSGNWQARIKVDGKMTSLGSYSDRVAADRAYNDAARIHFDPEFVQLNSP